MPINHNEADVSKFSGDHLEWWDTSSIVEAMNRASVASRKLMRKTRMEMTDIEEIRRIMARHPGDQYVQISKNKLNRLLDELERLRQEREG